MPELSVVGRVSDPDALDLEPVVVPVCAYKQGKDGPEEVVERFPFRPAMPPGVVALLERLGGQTIGVNQALIVLNSLVVDDASERWTEFLENPELSIDAEVLAELTKTLVEHYGGRPTRRSSGSSRTGGRSGRTSKAARPSQG